MYGFFFTQKNHFVCSLFVKHSTSCIRGELTKILRCFHFNLFQLMKLKIPNKVLMKVLLEFKVRGYNVDLVQHRCYQDYNLFRMRTYYGIKIVGTKHFIRFSFGQNDEIYIFEARVQILNATADRTVFFQIYFIICLLDSGWACLDYILP